MGAAGRLSSRERVGRSSQVQERMAPLGPHFRAVSRGERRILPDVLRLWEDLPPFPADVLRRGEGGPPVSAEVRYFFSGTSAKLSRTSPATPGRSAGYTQGSAPWVRKTPAGVRQKFPDPKQCRFGPPCRGTRISVSKVGNIPEDREAPFPLLPRAAAPRSKSAGVGAALKEMCITSRPMQSGPAL